MNIKVLKLNQRALRNEPCPKATPNGIVRDMTEGYKDQMNRETYLPQK